MAEENCVLPISFARCELCGKFGAKRDTLSKRFACSAGYCGMPDTINSAAMVESKLSDVLYDEARTRATAGVDGSMLADAVNWLALVPDDTANRHRNLLAIANRYRLSSVAPYSGMPLPVDVKLYNMMVQRARRYALEAIDKLSEVAPPSEAEEERRSRAREVLHNAAEESEVSAHGETLFLLYVTMFRVLLATYDMAIATVKNHDSFSAEDFSRTSVNERRYVMSDTFEAVNIVRSIVSAAVKRLFDEYHMSRAAIRRFLVEGVLADAEEDAFAALPEPSSDGALPDAGPARASVASPTKDGRMVDSLASAAINDRVVPDSFSATLASGSDAEFIQGVAAAHAGVFDWVKSRARRYSSKARSFSSSKAYDAFTLADLLYRLYVVNICTPEIAIATGLYVPALHSELPQGGQPVNESMAYFRPRYEAAYGGARVQGDNPQWANDFARLLGEVGSRGERAAREDRVVNYTCAKSSNARLQLSEFNVLPAKIAKQVSSMAAYFYSYDPKDAKSSERRMQNTAKDVVSLVRELRRKVGTDAARVLLQAVAPVYNK